MKEISKIMENKVYLVNQYYDNNQNNDHQQILFQENKYLQQNPGFWSNSVINTNVVCVPDKQINTSQKQNEQINQLYHFSTTLQPITHSILHTKEQHHMSEGNLSNKQIQHLANIHRIDDIPINPNHQKNKQTTTKNRKSNQKRMQTLGSFFHHTNMYLHLETETNQQIIFNNLNNKYQTIDNKNQQSNIQNKTQQKTNEDKTINKLENKNKNINNKLNQKNFNKNKNYNQFQEKNNNLLIVLPNHITSNELTNTLVIDTYKLNQSNQQKYKSMIGRCQSLKCTQTQPQQSTYKKYIGPYSKPKSKHQLYFNTIAPTTEVLNSLSTQIQIPKQNQSNKTNHSPTTHKNNIKKSAKFTKSHATPKIIANNQTYTKIKKNSNNGNQLNWNERIVEKFMKKNIKEQILRNLGNDCQGNRRRMKRYSNSRKLTTPSSSTFQNPQPYPFPQPKLLQWKLSTAIPLQPQPNHPSPPPPPINLDTFQIDNLRVDPIDLYQIKNKLSQQQFKNNQISIAECTSTQNFSHNFIISKGDIWIKDNAIEYENQMRDKSSKSYNSGPDGSGSCTGSYENSMHQLTVGNPIYASYAILEDNSIAELRRNQQHIAKAKVIASIANLQNSQLENKDQQSPNPNNQPNHNNILIPTSKNHAHTSQTIPQQNQHNKLTNFETKAKASKQEKPTLTRQIHNITNSALRIQKNQVNSHTLWQQYKNQIQNNNFVIYLWEKAEKDNQFHPQHVYGTLCTNIRINNTKYSQQMLQQTNVVFSHSPRRDQKKKQDHNHHIMTLIHQKQKQKIKLQFDLVLDFSVKKKQCDEGWQDRNVRCKQGGVNSVEREEGNQQRGGNKQEEETIKPTSHPEAAHSNQNQPVFLQQQIDIQNSNTIISFKVQSDERYGWIGERLMQMCNNYRIQYFFKFVNDVFKFAVIANSKTGKKLQFKKLQTLKANDQQKNKTKGKKLKDHKRTEKGKQKKVKICHDSINKQSKQPTDPQPKTSPLKPSTKHIKPITLPTTTTNKAIPLKQNIKQLKSHIRELLLINKKQVIRKQKKYWKMCHGYYYQQKQVGIWEGKGTLDNNYNSNTLHQKYQQQLSFQVIIKENTNQINTISLKQNQQHLQKKAINNNISNYETPNQNRNTQNNKKQMVQQKIKQNQIMIKNQQSETNTNDAVVTHTTTHHHHHHSQQQINDNSQKNRQKNSNQQPADTQIQSISDCWAGKNNGEPGISDSNQNSIYHEPPTISPNQHQNINQKFLSLANFDQNSIQQYGYTGNEALFENYHQQYKYKQIRHRGFVSIDRKYFLFYFTCQRQIDVPAPPDTPHRPNPTELPCLGIKSCTPSIPTLPNNPPSSKLSVQIIHQLLNQTANLHMSDSAPTKKPAPADNDDAKTIKIENLLTEISDQVGNRDVVINLETIFNYKKKSIIEKTLEEIGMRKFVYLEQNWPLSILSKYQHSSITSLLKYHKQATKSSKHQLSTPKNPKLKKYLFYNLVSQLSQQFICKQVFGIDKKYQNNYEDQGNGDQEQENRSIDGNNGNKIKILDCEESESQFISYCKFGINNRKIKQKKTYAVSPQSTIQQPSKLSCFKNQSTKIQTRQPPQNQKSENANKLAQSLNPKQKNRINSQDNLSISSLFKSGNIIKQNSKKISTKQICINSSNSSSSSCSSSSQIKIKSVSSNNRQQLSNIGQINHEKEIQSRVMQNAQPLNQLQLQNKKYNSNTKQKRNLSNIIVKKVDFTSDKTNIQMQLLFRSTLPQVTTTKLEQKKTNPSSRKCYLTNPQCNKLGEITKIQKNTNKINTANDGTKSTITMKKQTKINKFLSNTHYSINLTLSHIYGNIKGKAFYHRLAPPTQQSKFISCGDLCVHRTQFNLKNEQLHLENSLKQKILNEHKFCISIIATTKIYEQILQKKQIDSSKSTLKSIQRRISGFEIKPNPKHPIQTKQILSIQCTQTNRQFIPNSHTGYLIFKKQQKQMDNVYIKFRINPCRSSKNYYHQASVWDIGNSLMAKYREGCNYQVYGKYCESAPHNFKLTRNELQLYAQGIKKYASFTYFKYCINQPPYKIIHKKTKKLCTGMFIIFTIVYIQSMGCAFILAYINRLQKCYYFRLTLQRFKQIDNGIPIKIWEEIIQIYTQRFKNIYLKRYVDETLQQLKVKNLTLYHVMVCKNGIDSYVTNNYRALRETRGAKIKRLHPYQKNKKTYSNSMLDEDQSVIYELIKQKFIKDQFGRVFLVLFSVQCPESKLRVHSLENSRQSQLSSVDEQSIESSKKLIKIQIFQSNKFTKYTFHWNYQHQLINPPLDTNSSNHHHHHHHHQPSRIDNKLSKELFKNMMKKSFVCPIRIFRKLMDEITDCIRYQNQNSGENLGRKFKLLLSCNLSDKNNDNTSSQLDKYQNNYYHYYKYFTHGRWILIEQLSGTGQDQPNQSKGKQANEEGVTLLRKCSTAISKQKQKKIMIEYEKSQSRQSTALPNMGFQDCIPFDSYNKKLSKRVAKILSSQRVYN